MIANHVGSFLFPGDERLEVVIYAYLITTRSPPRIRAVADVPTLVFTEMGAIEVPIRSHWTVPDAAALERYREAASRADPDTGDRDVDPLVLRDMLVSHHLKTLTLPPDGRDFSLGVSREDRLPVKTIRAFKRMYPEVYDGLYGKFLAESCLVV